MSQHPSLKSGAKGREHRSVWKRFERLKFLVEKDRWTEGDSIFGLPKIKLLKLKIKKEKAAEAVAEGAAAGAEGVPAAGGAPAQEKGKPAPVESTQAKGGAQAKSGIGKEEAKGAAKSEKPEKK